MVRSPLSSSLEPIDISIGVLSIVVLFLVGGILLTRIVVPAALRI